MLQLTNVRFGYADQPLFLGPINVSIHLGECWAIVGPNGAGKSTLLRLMAGLCRMHVGCIRLDGQPLGDLSYPDRARRLAFVPQQPPSGWEGSVRELVLLGRFPHRSMGLFDSPEDGRMVDWAMTITQTGSFADRPLSTLSGGEAQRVHIAAALAQQPRWLLLDEPTASLDLRHQLAIFHLLRGRAEVDGLGVVVVTHDVNLAARFCTHVMLLDRGRCVATGTPADVLTPQSLEPVYGVSMTTLASPQYPDQRWVVPLARIGDEPS